MNSFDFGPQNHKDSPFIARMRFHQSWYRTQVLKLPCGSGPKPSNKVLLGNMLTEKDGKAGKNFLTPAILQSVHERLEIRRGMIEPFRLFCNMLSAQALCFNLFAPLQQNHALSVRLLKSLLPDQIRGVQKIMFAYFPEPVSELFNNNLPFEVLIEYKRPNGELVFVAVSIFLDDSTPHKPFTNPDYHSYTGTSDSPWQEDIWQSAATQQPINHIWRMHMLAHAFLQVNKARYADGFFMSIHPHQDAIYNQAMEQYRSCLKDSKIFLAFTLQDILQCWREQEIDSSTQDWLDAFSRRYMQFEQSENDFKTICNRSTS